MSNLDRAAKAEERFFAASKRTDSLDAIRARHTSQEPWSGRCLCGKWPCDTAIVLAALDAQYEYGREQAAKEWAGRYADALARERRLREALAAAASDLDAILPYVQAGDTVAYIHGMLTYDGPEGGLPAIIERLRAAQVNEQAEREGAVRAALEGLKDDIDLLLASCTSTLLDGDRAKGLWQARDKVDARLADLE